jgi:hypothetical protein
MSNYSQPNLATDDSHTLLYKAASAQYRMQQEGGGNTAASNVSVDSSSWDVISGSNAQAALTSADNALLQARSTGVLYGGIGSVNGGVGVGTSVDVTAGAGQILDNTNPENPTYTAVTWSALTDIEQSSAGTVYWYIDAAGALQQTSTAPTPDTLRTRLWLFQSSLNGGVITSLANISAPVNQFVGAIFDLSNAIGPIRVSGSQPTYSGANLKLKITSGQFYDFGVTRWNTPLAPNSPFPPTFDTGVSGNFRYITTSGVINVNQTDVQVANYQVAGVVTAIPGANTRVGVHYVIGFPSGNTRLSYGNSFYTNVTEALAAVGSTDPYTTLPSTVNRSNSFILGAVLAVKNATDLSNSAQATFVTTNRFGQFGGAIAIAGSSYVQGPSSATDNAIAAFDGTSGKIVKTLVAGAAVADASGGATVDAEARTAINTLLARLRSLGIIST